MEGHPTHAGCVPNANLRLKLDFLTLKTSPSPSYKKGFWAFFFSRIETQTSSSAPKLKRDFGFVRLTLFFNFVARVLGESSAAADVLASVSFSGEVCLTRTVGFVLFRLKMSGCVESEAIYNGLSTVLLIFPHSRYFDKHTCRPPSSKQAVFKEWKAKPQIKPRDKCVTRDWPSENWQISHE